MKVFCFFVEPASYTLDLALNIYDKNKSKNKGIIIISVYDYKIIILKTI